MNEFIINTRDEESVHLSIRIEKRILDRLDDLSQKSGRSRNHLINAALDYAIKNAKLID